MYTTLLKRYIILSLKVLSALIFAKKYSLRISVHVPTRRFHPVVKMASSKARSSILNLVLFKRVCNNSFFFKIQTFRVLTLFYYPKSAHVSVSWLPHHIQRCPFFQVKEKISFIGLFLKFLL